MSAVDPRRPVLVGAGVAGGGDTDAEAVELMAAAVESAADDASARSLLGAIDRVAVPQGTWSYADPGRLIAARVGAPGARTHLGELGVPQQTLINDALRAIRAGESDVAVVVGGEARARDRRAAVAGRPAPETGQPGARPDVVHRREPEFFADAEVTAGILTPPVQQYALIENALRDAEGRTLAEQRHEIDGLWSRFNQVAQGNPLAAFPAPRSPDALGRPGPGNRPLAFPYNKWHASQWTVDQAAALLLCSTDAAARHGVPADRLVHPLVGIDATHAVSLSRRRSLHRWPAMAVLGRAATERLGHPLEACAAVEVYSCFPSAVRVQQRELGLPLSGTPTVTGGMAFAGGPFNNFVFQATAAVVARLRERPTERGLVTTVCGMLTKPGLGVWSCSPDDQPALLADLAAEAARATDQVEVLDAPDGPVVVASYTVTYDADRPARVAVIGDTPDGRRCVAVVEDAALAAEAVRSEMIGATVTVAGGTFHR